MNKGGNNFIQLHVVFAESVMRTDIASLHILGSQLPFIKPQPFSSQPVLMCGVIPPQAQNLTLLPAEFQEGLGTVFTFLKVLLG